MAPGNPVLGQRPKRSGPMPRWRKLWLGAVVARAALLVPAALATEPEPAPPTPSVQAPARVVSAPKPAAPRKPDLQRIAGQEVEIEGKLYSPQALFIVARPHEAFGSDAIVPHYLQVGPSPRLLPYGLRVPGVSAPAAAADSAAADGANAGPVNADARRSP